MASTWGIVLTPHLQPPPPCPAKQTDPINAGGGAPTGFPPRGNPPPPLVPIFRSYFLTSFCIFFLQFFFANCRRGWEVDPHSPPGFSIPACGLWPRAHLSDGCFLSSWCGSKGGRRGRFPPSPPPAADRIYGSPPPASYYTEGALRPESPACSSPLMSQDRWRLRREPASCAKTSMCLREGDQDHTTEALFLLKHRWQVDIPCQKTPRF